jgi:beta-galactosidase
VRKGILTLDKPADTYLDLSKWGKGVVWINGHHLGKYWEIGPQQTIYVPAEWLKRGENEVVVFELNKSGQSLLRGIEKPVLNKLK